jgi:hypothetical protein
MSPQVKNMENEIVSLATTIKKNMVDPTGQRLRDMEDRLAAVERAMTLLNRAFLGAAVMIAASLGTIIYYLL